MEKDKAKDSDQKKPKIMILKWSLFYRSNSLVFNFNAIPNCMDAFLTIPGGGSPRVNVKEFCDCSMTDVHRLAQDRVQGGKRIRTAINTNKENKDQRT